MKIHEYQAKEIFARYGVETGAGKAAFSVEEAVAAAREIGGDFWVVKAQIHAGGRGKGGGVKLARSLEEVKAAAEALLGMTLVTPQTGPEGRLVRRLLVAAGTGIANELYLGILVDRKGASPTIIASSEGGMEIEEVSAKTPEKIINEKVNPVLGLTDYQARNVAFGVGLKGKQAMQMARMLKQLYKMFMDLDCSLVEINPLVVTDDGQLMALDAKVGFDDNALYRHKDVAELRDIHEEHPLEVEASEWDLNYIALDGNIGCMVNGAGLAMATMDIIKQFGGTPANFLDVGGNATKDRVAAAFKILTSEDHVKCVFVNIFGGIVQCDMLASGIVEASKEVGLKVPLIVRLEGTNVEEGRRILAESGLDIISAKDMAEGACKAVNAAK